ncbi:MAG: hypothetical protein HY916_03615 [Desulfovibrio sp.]|jgi:hypothetical protein|nr:hypothetical protein [Desulfovibrio sp.]
MCALWTKSNPDEEVAARNRRLVRDTIEDILDQRAKLRISFDSHVTNIKEITGVLAKVGGSGLAVEVSSLKSASKSWEGMGVSCYFRVRDREDPEHSHFFTFKSRVESVSVSPAGLVYFLLTPPETMEHAQQRRSVRVGAGPARLPAVMVWRELPQGANVAGTPPLFSTQDRDQGRLKVDNISTCGIRLVVQNALLTEKGLKPAQGERYSLYFKAMEEQEEMEKAFLANALLRNVFYDPQAGETALGLEFVDTGALDKERKLVWKPLRDNVLPEINAFIFKWNLLDFYRDKRVDEGGLS